MNIFELILLIFFTICVVIVNVWHGMLVRKNYQSQTANTISEYAAKSRQTLLVHRLAHIIAACTFITLGLYWLLHERYIEAAYALIVASLFDALQALTLSQHSAKRVFAVNAHSVTAWLMGIGYIVYAALISTYANLGTWAIIVLIASFVILTILAVIRKFNKFSIIQHSYFWLLAIIISVAHIRLFLAV